MKKVLVINLGWEQEPLIKRLLERSDCILFGIHDDKKPSITKHFQKIKILDFRDLEGILKFAEEINPDAVISDQCDFSLMAQALVAEKFNLPSPSLESAQLSNNKYLQRIKAKENGILVPAFKLCASIKDIENFVKKTGYPIIVKPIDNRGGFGVAKLNTKDDIKEAFFNAIKNSHSRMLLAESFIDGQQITVDGYAFKDEGIKSLVLGTKELINEITQVSIKIVYPGNLIKSLFSNALIVNEKVNKVLQYNFGMLHSEYIIRKNEIYLIESHNRGGGVCISEIIVPQSSGVDTLTQYISDCLGDNKNLFNKSKHKPVVLGWFEFKEGVVKNIIGWESFYNNINVLKAKLFFKKGDSLSNITNDANRHGFFIIKGSVDKANKLMSKVVIEYERINQSPSKFLRKIP
jgi:hypothetical protein